MCPDLSLGAGLLDDEAALIVVVGRGGARVASIPVIGEEGFHHAEPRRGAAVAPDAVAPDATDARLDHRVIGGLEASPVEKALHGALLSPCQAPPLLMGLDKAARVLRPLATTCAPQ